MAKNKKKLPALDKYVIFSLSCLVIFTVVILVIFAITGAEPTALVTCFFAAFGGELLTLAMIKRLKLKKGDDVTIAKTTPSADEEDNTNIDAFG